MQATSRNISRANYQDIRHLLSPLDLIFFRGNTILSDCIEGMQKEALGDGDFSHVGIVITKWALPSLRISHPFVNKHPDNTLFLWESCLATNNPDISPDHTLDVESNKSVLGVQIRLLDEVIPLDLQSNTVVAWSKLINNPLERYEKELDVHYQERILPITKILDKLHKIYYHRMYQINFCRMIWTLYPKCLCLKGSCCIGKKWIFCSELVTIVYRGIGIYSDLVDPEEVAPVMLIKPELCKEPLPMVLNPCIFLVL